MSPQFFDAVVVGAGFSGLNCLHELRKYGFSCKVFEAGSGLGGIWHFNCYPGARVDTEYSIYQFNQSEIGRDFPWTERFPGWAELQKYFSYVDERHNFSRDIQFNTRVTDASFNSELNQWEVTTSDSQNTFCRYFILCIGFAAKRYRPQFRGIEKFQGECYHTSEWSKDQKVDFKNKRVAVIGTGASGVQVIQELGPIVHHLTVFQRTPNLAMPMQQKKQGDSKWRFPTASDYDQIQGAYEKSHTGFKMEDGGKNCVNATEEERVKFFEELYEQGGFSFWRSNYQDTLFSAEANEIVYQFWRQKTMARIQDPVKREILAPAKQPHPFGTKRPSLEQSYYEAFNQSNVDLVDLRSNPIFEVTETGFLLENGKKVDVDIIILATGFDAMTGGIYQINIKNCRGQKLEDHWRNGIRTLVGLTTDKFPNMFFLYGPQSTTSFSSGPTSAKFQCALLLELFISMRRNGEQRVEAMKDRVENWTAHVHEIWNNSLFPLADSWYLGANIPGKKREPLSYTGGTPRYVQALKEAADWDFGSFCFGVN